MVDAPLASVGEGGVQLPLIIDHTLLLGFFIVQRQFVDSLIRSGLR